MSEPDFNVRKDEKSKRNQTVESSIKKGISFGTCLAMIISYTAWKSIPWAIFHGLLSWVYVVYYWAKYL
ncbi:hypothetical protein [Neobacillus sp. FSL H8-0543]|uniref:hypothetical protein n=1 Tax=Neobacillus sp. FSL H8-0543 TaxID=2954672 RepID=UPI003159337D